MRPSNQVVNGVALLAVSMHPRFSRHAFAGPAIIAGTAMFSGSIFALTVAKMKGLGDKCVLPLYLYKPRTALH